MNKIFLLLFFMGICIVGNAQIKVRFELNNIPKSKDINPTYFIAGNFNGWKPNDTSYKLSKLNDTVYILDKNLPVGKYEYKLTRGNWTTVESDADGRGIKNRYLTLKNDTLIKITVLDWTDKFKTAPPSTTAATNVKVLDTAFQMPQLNKKRKIWIYLPPSYGKSKSNYPVIYMHDGQNLFDEATSGFGEWKIDEILNKMSDNGNKEYIIVGIDHGDSARLNEYNPYDSEYGKGQGKAYTDFLVNTLKPFIDEHYRTKPGYKNTSIAGSSMGGLISMYAISRYPKVFGNAGIFSPAFWIGKEIETDLKQNQKLLAGHKIYFIAGDLESKTMTSDMKRVYQILNPTGKNNNIRFITKADGEHKEWFWSREFVDFYKFIAK